MKKKAKTMPGGSLVRELTASLLDGSTDVKVAAFLVLLDAITGADRDAEEVRRLAQMSAAVAFPRTDAFRSSLANFTAKHSPGREQGGGA